MVVDEFVIAEGLGGGARHGAEVGAGEDGSVEADVVEEVVEERLLDAKKIKESGGDEVGGDGADLEVVVGDGEVGVEEQGGFVDE